MPGTEAGSDEIKKTFSPCYGSPFMPRKIELYTNMLMEKIEDTDANVYLINTGMDKDGKRFPLEFTRDCVKNAMRGGAQDNSKVVSDILEDLL